MSSPTYTRRHWLMTGAALGLAACGGGADLTKARIRFVNASSGYDSLDLVVDGSVLFSSIAYGATATYLEADPARVDSSIRRTGAATSLLSFTPSVREDADYTVLAWGKSGGLASVVLDDNSENDDDAKFFLRVLNAAPDAGKLDVYITASGDDLGDAEPLFDPIDAGTLTDQATVTPGTWRLRVTAGGDATDLRLDVGSFGLTGKHSGTLVLTPGSGGVLVNALLLIDRGGVYALGNAQARVRVASGMPLGTQLTASAGGTTLVTNGGGLTVGTYKLVTAGDATLTVSVDGVAATGASASLGAGGDHTLLVWGSADAPSYTLLADDNQLPASSSRAKLRLVHGVSGLSGTLSLTADSDAVADGVAPGEASAYVEVPSGSGVTLTTSTPGESAPVTNSTDKTLTAGAVYTCFVVGTADAPQAILKLDRQ